MSEEHPEREARFLHEPRTEQEVVCLFGALLDDLGFPCLIEKVQTPFPDALIRRTDTREQLRVEFELYGSHFLDHGHPLDGCDLLVCWRDDWRSWPSHFQVLELSEIVARRRPGLIVEVDWHDPATPWDVEAFFAQARGDCLPERSLEVARQIIALAAKHGLGPRWLKGPRAVFVVGDDQQFFKVTSDGRLVFPFSRLSAGERFEELASRLNRVLPALELGPDDVGSKGKGGQLSDLFSDDEILDDFFDVWLWFRSTR